MDYLPNGKTFRGRHVYVTETLRIMRLTAILLLAACLQVSARGYTQGKVSLSEKDATLDKVFKDLRKQTGYSFMYQKGMLTESKKITLDVQDASLEEVLQICFKDQPLTYSIISNLIVVQKKAPAPSNYSPPSPPLQDIRGTITGDDGNPVPNATITVKGTKIAALADIKGNFVLRNVESNVILSVSSIGYETFEIEIKGRTEIKISLKRNVGQLDEMQVIAYGTVSRRFNTGDVTTVKSDVIQEQPVSDPIQALEGRVPGLYIQQASGIPGAYSTVRIMGQNSIANGNEPLYVIDGVPFSSSSLTNQGIGGGAVGDPANNTGSSTGYGMSPFNSLNPSDIESIEVLKDADATAIYGSRGANGVILITTKKGKSGNTKYDVNIFSGAGKITRQIDFMNTPEYLQMRVEADDNDGYPPSSLFPQYDPDLFYFDTTRYTNWQKVLIANSAQFTSAQANISGGNDNTQFVLGGGYSKQGTVYQGEYNDQKASAYINLTHSSINQRFRAQFTATYTNDNSNLPSSDFTGSIDLAPDAPTIYDVNGNLNWQAVGGTATWNNPLGATLIHANATTNNLISSLNLSYLLLPGLHLKSNFGYTIDEMNQSILFPASAYGPPNSTNPSYRANNYGTTDFKTWIIEPQLNYQKKIAKGQLDILAGSTFQENDQTSISYSASGFSSDALISNIEAASTLKLENNTNTLYHYDAIFGRINYIWDDKYIINVTGRRDGSSRFGPGKQFGDFGAIGAGWILSKEKLISNGLPWLSFGKLRVSYGTTGNDQITDYQYLSTYSSNPLTYQSITGLYPARIANPYFGWELVKKIEGGLDIGLLKDRILLSATYYRNRTGNQLVGYSLPAVTGFTSIQANLPAIVQNTGEEFTLNTTNLKTRNFSWRTSVNLTIPHNKLVSYPNLSSSSYKDQYVVGKSLFIKRVFHIVGVNDSTGTYEYASVKKGPTDNPSYPQDLQVSKPITQNYFGGFNNTFQYHGFQLDIFFQFVKQTGYNILNDFYSPGSVERNVPTYFLKRWQKPGDITNVGKYSIEGSADPYGWLGFSDFNISDASFIRLKNLSLSYTLPESWQQRAHLQNARIYLQGQNLFTITKYLGLDPETGGLNLPPLRMLTAGIQLTF